MTLLEICIPTFNRVHVLRHTLPLAVNLLTIYPNELSIYVSDNASTDDTSGFCATFSQHSNFTYYRQQSNLGLIGNIAHCYERSTSSWTWVVGDDDFILPHAIQTLLQFLSSQSPHVGYCRALSLSTRPDGSLSKSQQSLDCFSETFSPGTALTSKLKSIHDLAFISQTIVRPSLWDSSYFSKIYNPTQLYTFVFVFLRSLKTFHSVSLNLHIVAATDRGDRSYYYPKLVISRLTEYQHYYSLILGFSRVPNSYLRNPLSSRRLSNTALVLRSTLLILAGQNYDLFFHHYHLRTNKLSPFFIDRCLCTLLSLVYELLKKSLPFSLFQKIERRLKPSYLS